MAWIVASLTCAITTLFIAAYLILRWRRGVEQQHRQFLEQLTALQSQLSATRHELELLKAAVSAKQSITITRSPQDPLDQIEQLGQCSSLANRSALEEIARQTAALPNGVAANLFEFDQKLLDISRLIHQGHSTSEIAHRLHLPQGEVELLANIRT